MLVLIRPKKSRYIHQSVPGAFKQLLMMPWIIIHFFLQEYGAWAVGIALVLLGGVITAAVKGDISTWSVLWENLKELGKVVGLFLLAIYQLVRVFVLSDKKKNTKLSRK